MASSMKSSLILFFTCSLFLQVTYAVYKTEVKCESLPNGDCAFAISSTGKRCVLEKATTPKDDLISSEYECKTSEVIVENMKEHIETDECIESCGLNRNFFGISSDDLLEPQFVSKLCAPACYQECPNIVDLYFNLAAGEGAYLPDLCNKNKKLQSSGAAEDGVDAPAPSPSIF
uniref:NtEIG-E80 protein n=1 Tax=Solanum tuberosum TaxID=4113 RepID=M1BTB6_SOLTU